jgi:amino acid adenylation domain-containing protein/thioester reductase-like protein
MGARVAADRERDHPRAEPALVTSGADLLRAAFATHGPRRAIESDGRALSYQELDQMSARVARFLVAQDVGERPLVALALERSIEHVVALIATWRAGAAFVPVPCDAPRGRRNAVAARARLVLDRGSFQEALRHAGRETIDPRLAGADLAYVIYTSGSSGAPKGVMIAHRGIPRLVRAQIDAFRLRAGARALWSLSPAFDASISDILTALCAGATLVVPRRERIATPADLCAEIARRAITHADLPPSLLALVPDDALPACLETIVIGGEPCPVEVVRRVAARVRLVNVYGPTEATVCASLTVCTPEWCRPAIGVPLPGVRYRVVGGELYIAGDGVALGYLGDAALTAERFVEEHGARWYRTGDRVVAHVDGDLEFVGRVDRQLKIGGVRIEPAEIERALLAQQGVARVAVALRSKRLVAFVTACAGAVLDVDALRAELAQLLPPAMIPAQIAIGDLPITESGKIDFAALVEGEAVAVHTPLHEAWCAALGVTHASAEDDFFARGDSLAVLALVVAAEARGLHVAPEQIYERRTLAALAQSLPASEWRPTAQLVRAAEDARDGLDRCRESGRSGAILLTGATGMLGSRLLGELAERSREPIVCLVRAPHETLASDRFEMVIGNVAAPRFGLEDAQWRDLGARVGHVIHAAARVHLGESCEQLAATNVGGTREVLRFCALDGKRLDYISTLSVVAQTEQRGTLREEDVAAASVCGGYAQSKWIAERLVRDVAPHARIHRLGLLTRGDGSRDQLSRVIRGLARLGCAPFDRADLAFDMTAVDWAARAIATLATGAAPGVYHLANQTSASADQLVTAIRARGVPIADVSRHEWRTETRAASDPDATFAALAFGALSGHRSADLFLATGAVFDTSRARAALGDLHCPPPSELLDACVVSALRSTA